MGLPPGMVGVRFALPLVSGHFIRRLTPGRLVLLEPARGEGRRTRFTLGTDRLSATPSGA